MKASGTAVHTAAEAKKRRIRFLKLVPFPFYNEVCELMRAIQKYLMWHARRNAHNIASGKLNSRTPFDRAVTLLVRRNRFAIQIFAADEKGGGAGLYEENIDLIFVPFDGPVRLAAHQEKGFIRKIGQLLDGEVMWIGGRLFRKQSGNSLESGLGPVLETIGSGLLG